MSAIDNARAALDDLGPGWKFRQASALRNLITEYERLTAEGSCWDEAPSIIVPKGECAPMPARCELRSGHGGAHRSGHTEWMRRGPLTAEARDDLRLMNDIILASIAEWAAEDTDTDLTIRIRTDLLAAGFRRPIHTNRGL